MIQNHACGGFPSNRVFLALRDLDGDGVPFVLDLRPLLLDISWELAPSGRVDVASVCTRIAARCPPSHFVRLVGGHAPLSMANHVRIVFPGQVLWAEFWQRRGSFLDGPADDGEDGAPPGDEPGDDDDSAPDTDRPAASSGSVSTRVDAGTGSTQRHLLGRSACPAEEHTGVNAHTHGPIATWQPVSRLVAFPEGKPAFTPGSRISRGFQAWGRLASRWDCHLSRGLLWGLLCAICQLLLVACLALVRCAQCLRQAGRGRMAVCLLVLYFALNCIAAGVQIRDISDCSTAGSAAARTPLGPATVRRLPRPLIGRFTEDVAHLCGEPASEVAEILGPSHREAPPDILGCDACVLTTLLEESIARHDSRAFLLASTLLETLTEHFFSDDSGSIVDEPRCSVGGLPGPVRTLCLDTLVPSPDKELTVVPCSAAPEQFDLTEGQCVLPCGNSLFDSLCRKIDPRFLRGPAHAVDKAWRFREWVAAGSQGRSPAPGERLTLTADGSFCPETGRAGWAVVVGLATPPDQLGQFIGCIYGPVPEDARRQAVNAYVAEVWGLVWAGVVALQLPTRGEILFRADNLSALQGAAGDASTAPILACDVLPRHTHGATSPG